MANPVVSATAGSGLDFYGTLQGQQQQAFQGQQAALSAVNSMWAPIMSTGAIPYGYSAALDSLLRSNDINEAAAGTTNAMNAENLRLQQESGGANVLPSGATAQIQADIGATGAQSEAQTLANEKIAGYQQGLQNVEGATSAELGVASGENAAGTANAATNAGNLALNAGNTQWQENQATSPLNVAKSVLGDIGTAAGDITGIGNVASMFSTPSSTTPSTPINGATASLPLTMSQNNSVPL